MPLQYTQTRVLIWYNGNSTCCVTNDHSSSVTSSVKFAFKGEGIELLWHCQSLFMNSHLSSATIIAT